MKRLLLITLFSVTPFFAFSADAVGEFSHHEAVMQLDELVTYSSLKVTAHGPCTATLHDIVVNYADSSCETHEMDALELNAGDNVEIALDNDKPFHSATVYFQGCARIQIEGISESGTAH